MVLIYKHYTNKSNKMQETHFLRPHKLPCQHLFKLTLYYLLIKALALFVCFICSIREILDLGQVGIIKRCQF